MTEDLQDLDDLDNELEELSHVADEEQPKKRGRGRPRKTDAEKLRDKEQREQEKESDVINEPDFIDIEKKESKKEKKKKKVPKNNEIAQLITIAYHAENTIIEHFVGKEHQVSQRTIDTVADIASEQLYNDYIEKVAESGKASKLILIAAIAASQIPLAMGVLDKVVHKKGRGKQQKTSSYEQDLFNQQQFIYQQEQWRKQQQNKQPQHNQNTPNNDYITQTETPQTEKINTDDII